MQKEKVVGILELIEKFGLPLMEQGAEATGTEIDDYFVALLKGGIPEVIRKMRQKEAVQGK